MVVFLIHACDLSAKVIPVTDRNVKAGLSPYNWVCIDGAISSTVCGASVTVKFRGTSIVSLLVETDHMQFESPNSLPVLAWTVNGSAVRTHQLVYGEILVELSADVQDPVIDLFIRGLSPMEDRYSGDVPPNSVKISGFVVNDHGSTAKLKLPKKVWLDIGDSILSGDGAALLSGQGRPEDDRWAASGDSRAGYGYLLASHFGYRESRLAYGGYDWGGGMAGIPSLEKLIDSTTTTVCRLVRGKLSPLPDVVLINLGENGAPAAKDVTEALIRIRSRVAQQTKIIVMVPVSGRARREVTQAFSEYRALSGDEAAWLVDAGFFGFDTGDGQHPTAEGHQTVLKTVLPAFEAILEGRYQSPFSLPLWTGAIPESAGRPAGESPSITVYRPVNANGTAVVICPGGGYGMLVTGPEGHGIAQWLNRSGITGIVLEYRLPKGNYKIPLADVQRAIRLVRSQAAGWGIDPGRIGIAGFSAGGHLASTAATHFDAGNSDAADPVEKLSCRPDFAVLVYPVVTMGPATHGGSKRNLLGADPSSALADLFSNEKQVTDQTPPVFLAHALDDEVVLPANSQNFYDALLAYKVPAYYLKLPSGGHGLNGYQGPMWDAWQAESMKWLSIIFPGAILPQ
jgi:acetyl esterase/lipase